MDSNAVENRIRPLVLNRKNALFAGHDEGPAAWGRIASLIETAKMNRVEPYAYLKATLEAIAHDRLGPQMSTQAVDTGRMHSKSAIAETPRIVCPAAGLQLSSALGMSVRMLAEHQDKRPTTSSTRRKEHDDGRRGLT